MLTHNPSRSSPTAPAALLLAMLVSLLVGCAVRTPASAVRFAPAASEEAAAHPVPWRTYRSAELLAAIDAARITRAPGRSHPGACTFNDSAMRLLRTDHPFILRGMYGQAAVFESFIVREPNRGHYRVMLTSLDEADLIEATLKDEPGDVEDDHVFRFAVDLELPASSRAASEAGPDAAAPPSPRGVAIHLVSLGNTDYERAALDELRDRGWAILRFLPDPFTLRVLAVDREAPDDPDRMQVVAADDLARQVDDQHAALAEAVSAMLAYLDDARPEAASDRIAVVGFSLGALAGPAVAHRLEDEVDALVLVGGGADVSTILIKGSLTRFDRAVRGDVRRTLLELPPKYRRATRLDGYNIGPLIRRIPTLMLQASFDAVIPGSTGDLLYERLGRPERWSYPLGHFGLFWWLPNEAKEMADWIEQASARAASRDADDDSSAARSAAP